MGRGAEQSKVVDTVEMEYVAILNRVVRVDFTGKISLMQKLE